MGTRLDLQGVLEDLLESEHVYFQPPENLVMQYPAIVYRRDYHSSEHADNRPYSQKMRYQVTVIDRDPDSELPKKVLDLPTAAFVRHFSTEGLNHDIYSVYY